MKINLDITIPAEIIEKLQAVSQRVNSRAATESELVEFLRADFAEIYSNSYNDGFFDIADSFETFLTP